MKAVNLPGSLCFFRRVDDLFPREVARRARVLLSAGGNLPCENVVMMSIAALAPCPPAPCRTTASRSDRRAFRLSGDQVGEEAHLVGMVGDTRKSSGRDSFAFSRWRRDFLAPSRIGKHPPASSGCRSAGVHRQRGMQVRVAEYTRRVVGGGGLGRRCGLRGGWRGGLRPGRACSRRSGGRRRGAWPATKRSCRPRCESGVRTNVTHGARRPDLHAVRQAAEARCEAGSRC